MEIKMKNFFIALTLLILLTINNLSASNAQEKKLHNILRNFVNYQTSLGYTMEMNGAMCPEKYERFIYSFDSTKSITLDEARKHIVYSIEKLLLDLNSDKSIASILIKQPLQPDNINIYFYYKDNALTACNESFLSSVWFHKNNEIHFDYILKSTGIKTSIIEPYNEAYEKVYGHKRL